MKKVIVQFKGGITPKQYDQVWTDLRSAGHSNPKGLIYHVGAKQDNNIIVTDVWESAEAFNTFGETLIPIMMKNGVDANIQPVITPIHFEYSASEVAVTE